MNAELLMIGTELLLGQIIDTNSVYLAQKLAEIGIDVYRKTTVGDNQQRIAQCIREALTRADIVICCGGLGPTVDDMTRESIAEATNLPLIYHSELFQKIFERLEKRGVKVSENNKKQAMLPQGASVIPNPIGTAPGFIVEQKGKYIVTLPGVPFELKAMFEDTIIPFFMKEFKIEKKLFIKVLKVYGLGESRVDDALGDLLYSSSPTIGLLASPECVKIRLAVKACNEQEAENLFQPMVSAIYQRLPNLVLSGEDYSLEREVDRILCSKEMNIIIIDAQTAGMIIYRMHQAKAKSLLKGDIYNLETGVWKLDDLFDIEENYLLSFPLAFVLTIYPDFEAKKTKVRARQRKIGEYHWELPFYGAEERDRTRIAVVALEQVRRSLLNIEIKNI